MKYILPHNQIVIGEHANLMHAIDEQIHSTIRKEIDVINANVPSLISHNEIIKMNYEKTFYGHLTTASPICNSKERFELIPAACLPLYAHIPQILHDEEACLSFRVPVFRYEDGKRSEFRFWEFNVREFVFIGTEEYVLDCLSRVEECIVEFCKDEDIPVKLKYGSDYFTGETKEIAAMKRLQKANKLKKEVVWMNGDEEVALASINYHMSHFSKTYGWDKNGKIVSGCVGFGLERWLTMWEKVKGLVMPNTNEKKDVRS